MASQRSFRVSYTTNEKQKKEAMNASFLFLERITRLARLAFALTDTHPTDEQSPGLFLASQRSFRVSYTTNEKQKKEAMNASFLFLERITRLARLAFALTDTHPTDEQSPGLFLASQRSFRVSYTTNEKQKKEAMNASFLFLERITRLELATFTLAR